jgi:hypothetical protein
VRNEELEAQVEEQTRAHREVMERLAQAQQVAISARESTWHGNGAVDLPIDRGGARGPNLGII